MSERQRQHIALWAAEAAAVIGRWAKCKGGPRPPSQRCDCGVCRRHDNQSADRVAAAKEEYR